MNYRGSYRKLLANSQAAMLAAIEIYNKPQFDYRDECFVILLVNGWELALKACLSKNVQSIFYPKKRDEPYKTLSVKDALNRASAFFPSELPSLSIKRNLELLVGYRDKAVHFYNSPGFGILIYALAQTSIVNYKDFLRAVFGRDLTQRISWHLLPIGVNPPIDPIEYIGGIQKDGGKIVSPVVREFITELVTAVRELQDQAMDTGRLLTVFDVTLHSVKKIELADVLVGVSSGDNAEGANRAVTVIKTQDPNKTHPLRTKDVVQQLSPRIGPYELTALVWKHSIKSNPQWCWRDSKGAVTMYSREMLLFLRRLSDTDINVALDDYRAHLRQNKKTRVKAVR